VRFLYPGRKSKLIAALLMATLIFGVSALIWRAFVDDKTWNLAQPKPSVTR
jgi:hypothetical protein